MNEKNLSYIVGRKGYGITSSLGKGSIVSEISGAGKIDDLESDSLHASMGAKRLQIRCREKIRVGITFYRRRLADYSRAISEKAIIDCLTKSGLISNDSEKEIWLEDKGQYKVETDEEERTELTISYPEVDLDNLWEESDRTDGR